MHKKQKVTGEGEADGVVPSHRSSIFRELKGVIVVFGPVVAIVMLIGFIYYPLADDNHWGPVERASCVSGIDGEQAGATFDRSGSYYRLRSGSDAGMTVHPRAGTADWKCRRDNASR